MNMHSPTKYRAYYDQLDEFCEDDAQTKERLLFIAEESRQSELR